MDTLAMGLSVQKVNFARGKCHVNDIESLWIYCKSRLAKFNGLCDEKFLLHLKANLDSIIVKKICIKSC